MNEDVGGAMFHSVDPSGVHEDAEDVAFHEDDVVCAVEGDVIVEDAVVVFAVVSLLSAVRNRPGLPPRPASGPWEKAVVPAAVG